MAAKARKLEPELLDELPPDEPRAVRSRLDLQRVHRAMGSLAILRRLVARLHEAGPPRRILELGAGDGTLLLRFARSHHAVWPGVELTLLDRQSLVSPATLAAFQNLGWSVQRLTTDVLPWSREVNKPSLPVPRYDLCVTSLFLHHFDAPALKLLLRAVAARSNAFIACEPRRDWLAGIGSRLIGLLGVNAVTRGDAVKSVAAGFRGTELMQAWRDANGAGSPIRGLWQLQEFAARPFTHCFIAERHHAR
jgi:SAM-dependent methyltransferase